MTHLLAQRPRTDRAFERLYRRHVKEVYRYALAVLPSAEDAEDVTQTAFLNAYRARERGKSPRSARNWLIAIAHELCRQRVRQDARLQKASYEKHPEEAVPEEETPTHDDVRRALGNLAFDERAALVMREVEGRSYAEIAEIQNVSLGTVETLIFRARRALREGLDGALSCHETERAISRRLDGKLARSERRPLREHLHECGDCARFDHSQRSQRAALRSLAQAPLPSSLGSFFEATGAGIGSTSKA
jgi:RNA polymerase sigma-70 factor, ECF subfamily